MKTWTQEKLPLKILEDLGPIFATEDSAKKARYMVFECPICTLGFRAEPSKVASGTKKQCKDCSNKLRTTSKVNPVTGLKKCNSCDSNKELSEFYANSRRADGIDSRCKECVNSYKSKWTSSNKEKSTDSRANARLVARYGITLDEYNKIAEEQSHLCKICGNGSTYGRGSSTKLSVDHCHTTGKVRGLLCQKCNTGLGLLGDTTFSLEKALQYLQEAEK